MPLTAGEADDQQPALRRQRPERVGEDVATDDVEDDVDALAVGELEHGLLEAVDQHRLVRAGPARQRGLLLGADHGDGAGAQPPGHLDGRGADPAGRAVHEDGLALPDLAALDEGELGGEVVHRHRGACVEGQLLGQREDRHRRGGDQLCRAAVRQHAGDPLPDVVAVGTGDDGAGEVDPEGERRLRLELVLTLAQQEVGERDAHAVHLDQDLVGPGSGLVDVDDPHPVGAGGRDDLYGAHVREHVR